MSDKHSQRNSHDDPVEQLLDRALASYTPVEPRLGLQDRVRARIAAAGSEHRKATLPLQWTGAAAAMLAAVVLLMGLLRSHTDPGGSNLTAVQQAPSVPGVSGPIGPAILPQGSGKPSQIAVPGPRPSPRQPTQEQLMARLIAIGPDAIASLARSQSAFQDQADKPIVIQPLPADPLVIEPIVITPMDDNPAEAGGSF